MRKAKVQVGRDKAGRFTTGHRHSVGNRGNTTPKWGNRNAVKHGLFVRTVPPVIGEDGWLYIPDANLKVSPEAFYVRDGRIYVRQDILQAITKG